MLSGTHEHEHVKNTCIFLYNFCLKSFLNQFHFVCYGVEKAENNKRYNLMPEVVKYYLFYVWYVPNDVGYLEVEKNIYSKLKCYESQEWPNCQRQKIYNICSVSNEQRKTS